MFIEIGNSTAYDDCMRSGTRPLCLRCFSKLSRNGFRNRTAYTFEDETLRLVKYELPRWICPNCHSRYHTLLPHLLYHKRYDLCVYEHVCQRQIKEITIDLNDSMIRTMKRETEMIQKLFIQQYGIERAEILCQTSGWLQKMVYMNQLFHLDLPTHSLETSQYIWYHHEKSFRRDTK